MKMIVEHFRTQVLNFFTILCWMRRTFCRFAAESLQSDTFDLAVKYASVSESNDMNLEHFNGITNPNFQDNAFSQLNRN